MAGGKQDHGSKPGLARRSGGSGRLAGSTPAIPSGGHFIGPAFTLEQAISKLELEIGVAWLHRIAGEGPQNSARLFVQFGR